MSRRFGALCSNFIGRIDKTTNEDGTEGSDSSAHKIQTPGYYQKKEIQRSQQGKSLKSGFIIVTI